MKLDKDVYEPAEDSYLLIRALKHFDFKDKEVLEIGTGTGIIAIEVAKKGGRVLATDINPKAVKLAKENAKLYNVNIDVVESDLFEKVNKKFDFILFNPPYLPTDENDRIDGYINYAFDGGPEGKDVLKRFIEKVDKYLKEDGKILIVISSLTNLEDVTQMFKNKGFKVRIIEKEKIPFEELYVLLITKK